MFYVIVDPARNEEEMDGYACNILMEGWAFTWLLDHATKFDSFQKAKNVMKEHYKNQGEGLIILEITEKPKG